MKNLKRRQKSRNSIYFLMVVMASLTFITLLSCTGSKAVKNRTQLVARTESVPDLKVNSPDPNQSANQSARNTTPAWVCASCGHPNTKPTEICISCGINKKEIRRSLSRSNLSKTKEQEKLNPQNKPTVEQDNSLEDCPICFEERVLINPQSHQCSQCKKLICVDCYVRMQGVKMYFCPLCKYTNRPPKHRRRTNTI